MLRGANLLSFCVTVSRHLLLAGFHSLELGNGLVLDGTVLAELLIALFLLGIGRSLMHVQNFEEQRPTYLDCLVDGLHSLEAGLLRDVPALQLLVRRPVLHHDQLLPADESGTQVVQGVAVLEAVDLHLVEAAAAEVVAAAAVATPASFAGPDQGVRSDFGFGFGFVFLWPLVIILNLSVTNVWKRSYVQVMSLSLTTSKKSSSSS